MSGALRASGHQPSKVCVLRDGVDGQDEPGHDGSSALSRPSLDPGLADPQRVVEMHETREIAGREAAELRGPGAGTSRGVREAMDERVGERQTRLVGTTKRTASSIVRQGAGQRAVFQPQAAFRLDGIVTAL